MIKSKGKCREREANGRGVLALCFGIIAVAIGRIAERSGASGTFKNTDCRKTIVLFREMDIFRSVWF